MAAPRVGLAAHVAAAKHGMIGLTLRKQARNLQFVQWSQETEILNLIVQIRGHIVSEIALKLNGFAVLVVDVVAWHSRLIGTVFVGKRNVFRPASKRNQNADERQ